MPNQQNTSHTNTSATSAAVADSIGVKTTAFDTLSVNNNNRMFLLVDSGNFMKCMKSIVQRCPGSTKVRQAQMQLLADNCLAYQPD